MRDILLPPSLKAALERQRQAMQNEASIRGGEKLPTSDDLRHTAGTLMLRRNVPIEVVSKTLGHSEKRAHVVDLFDSLPKARVVTVLPLN